MDFQLIATDANTHLLQRATEACYPAGNVKDIPNDWLKIFFIDNNGEYRLKNIVKNVVTFYNQDIRKEMPERKFDIVFCKNLVGMYFAPEKATEVYNRLVIKISGMYYADS